jgi:hypothetical protein
MSSVDLRLDSAGKVLCLIILVLVLRGLGI